MTTIDHPLLEAERALATRAPDALARIQDEWQAGPRTAARLRESIFEILGPTFQGCVPLAITEVLDPEAVEAGFDVKDRWAALGIIDDASVLRLADGSWFGLGRVEEVADRPMALLFLADEDARRLQAHLADGGQPVWAVPATNLLPLGTESELRALMDEPVGGPEA